MAKNLNDSYEYKEAPIRSALEYASFGWQIGKSSEHYSKKLNREVVTLRRDFIISANPTIRDCERDYLKLEKGKLPSKYKTHGLLRFLGKLFIILLMLASLVAGAVLAAVGVYDAVSVEKRRWAIYNAAVENGISDEPYYVLDTDSGIIMPDSYEKFVRDNPEVDTFGELFELAKGKANEQRLLNSYKNWLNKFELTADTSTESAEAVDPSVIKGQDGYPIEEGGIMDTVRGLTLFMRSGMYFSGMPLWINLQSICGCALILIFIILLLIEIIAGKKRKKKTQQKCVVHMKECLRIAADALYDLKMENRGLMTKKDMQLYDLETMFTQVMEPRGDDYD